MFPFNIPTFENDEFSAVIDRFGNEARVMYTLKTGTHAGKSIVFQYNEADFESFKSGNMSVADLLNEVRKAIADREDYYNELKYREYLFNEGDRVVTTVEVEADAEKVPAGMVGTIKTVYYHSAHWPWVYLVKFDDLPIVLYSSDSTTIKTPIRFTNEQLALIEDK